jgi:hypothetical protein
MYAEKACKYLYTFFNNQYPTKKIIKNNNYSFTINDLDWYISKITIQCFDTKDKKVNYCIYIICSELYSCEGQKPFVKTFDYIQQILNFLQIRYTKEQLLKDGFEYKDDLYNILNT